MAAVAVLSLGLFMTLLDLTIIAAAGTFFVRADKPAEAQHAGQKAAVA
jgi:hypothetical protein